MIILIGAQKGGVGKSTIAVNLCAYFAQNNYDFMLVDTDSGNSGQPTATEWVEDRDEEDLPEVSVVQLTGDIRERVKRLSNKYDYVIIDAAGRDSKELRTGMLIADLAILLFGTGKPERNTAGRVQEIISGASDINPNLKAVALLNRVATNKHLKRRKTDRISDLFGEISEFKLMNQVLHFRDAFEEAWEEGRGVIELPNRSSAKAKEEFLGFIEELQSLFPELKLPKKERASNA